MQLINILSIILQEAEEPGLFSLDLGVSFWTIVIFLVLLFVLAKYAFPPILGYAQAREDRISRLLDEAAEDRAEAERLLAEQKEGLNTARRRADEIVANAKQAGERAREEIMADAREEHEELLARARKEIGIEREKALEALRREAVDLSMAAAGKVVEQRLDAAED